MAKYWDEVKPRAMAMAVTDRRDKGKIAFWGEIDRQHVLPAKDPAVGRRAVREVARHFYDPAGGVFVQFEISPGTQGPTAIAVMEEWDAVQREHGVPWPGEGAD